MGHAWNGGHPTTITIVFDPPVAVRMPIPGGLGSVSSALAPAIGTSLPFRYRCAHRNHRVAPRLRTRSARTAFLATFKWKKDARYAMHAPLVFSPTRRPNAPNAQLADGRIRLPLHAATVLWDSTKTSQAKTAAPSVLTSMSVPLKVLCSAASAHMERMTTELKCVPLSGVVTRVHPITLYPPLPKAATRVLR